MKKNNNYIYLHLLTEKDKNNLIIFSSDINKHNIFLKQKIFWFIYKNITILNEKSQPLVFNTFSEAYDFLNYIIKKTNI